MHGLLAQQSGYLRHLVFDTLLSRAVPAYLCAFLMAGKALVVARYLEKGPGADGPLSYWFTITQQSLTATFVGLLAVLFIVRRPVVGRRSSLKGGMVALAGTVALMAPVGAAVHEDQPVLVLVSVLLVLAGTSLAATSLATLGRCFGIMPEARGLVTGGPYRWVRHPAYLGEIVSGLGMVVATISPLLLAVFALFCGLQYWRALMEEETLTAVFPEYAEYRQRTYRLLPWIH